MQIFNSSKTSVIWRRIIASFALTAFLLSGGIAPVRLACAQEMFRLPEPGTRVGLSASLVPPSLKGIKVYPSDPLRFDFILDQGDKTFTEPGEVLREQEPVKVERLIKYFLAAVTIPEKDLWVNLSPYEKDRIVPEAFGQTEMGRDLLAQDYILKQVTASLIYPEGDVGRKFWQRVYEEADKKYGITDIPVDTFNKVWIVPEKAVVYENAQAGTAYVVESKLKVMAETDYLSLSQGNPLTDTTITKSILREIIIPVLEKEVNEGVNFAQLRQVYHSLILAAWYKKKIKESLLSKAYVDQKKVAGISIDDPKVAEKIWARYVEAFKKGAFNFIKEEQDAQTREMLPRKYFSGGVDCSSLSDMAMKIVDDAASLPLDGDRRGIVEVRLETAESPDPLLKIILPDEYVGGPYLKDGTRDGQDQARGISETGQRANQIARDGLRHSLFTATLGRMGQALDPEIKAQALSQALRMSLYAAAPATVDNLQGLLAKALESPLVLDSTREFIREVLTPRPNGASTKGIYFLDDNEGLIYHLYLAQAYLLENPKLELTLVPKSERVEDLATTQDVLHEIDQPEFAVLKEMIAQGRVKVLEKGPVDAGVDLYTASKDLILAITDSDVVIGVGQAVTETLNGIRRPVYLQARVDSVEHQRLTGLSQGDLYFARFRGYKRYFYDRADDQRRMTMKQVAEDEAKGARRWLDTGQLVEIKERVAPQLDEMRQDYINKTNFTTPARFRELARGVGRALAAEAVNQTGGHDAAVVFIWRAALSFSIPFREEGFTRFAHIDLSKNRSTFTYSESYRNFEAVKGAKKVILVDPMFSTGGSFFYTIKELIKEEGIDPKDITIVAAVGTPVGIDKVLSTWPDVKIIVASVDQDIDSNGYIVPGLGDFGDRSFSGISEREEQAFRDAGILNDQDLAALMVVQASKSSAKDKAALGEEEQGFVRDWESFFQDLEKVPDGGVPSGKLNSRGVKHMVFLSPLQLKIGGVQTYQKDVIRSILGSERDVTVELIYFNFGSGSSGFSFQDARTNNRLLLKGIPARSGDGIDLDDGKQADVLAQELQEMQKRAKIDLIFLNSSTPYFNLLSTALAFADKMNIASEYYFHGGAITEGVRSLIERADVAVTNSRAYQKVFESLGLPGVGLLYPVSEMHGGMDRDEQAVQRIREQYGLSDRKIILHPGRIAARKGQELTIYAAARLFKEHPELAAQTAFVIVGPERNATSGDRLRLRRLARQLGVDVTFVDGQTSEELRNWYDASYLVLYPTLAAEPFGLVPVEAQERGVPVIVSNGGGLPETLRDGETGFISAQGDHHDLARKIHDLVSHEKKRDRMGIAARKYVQKRFALKRNIREITRSFIEAVEAGKTAGKKPEVVPGPEEVRSVLSNIYNLQAPFKDENGMDREQSPEAALIYKPQDTQIIRDWKLAWFNKLNESRSYWKVTDGFTIPVADVNGFRPPLAYDPLLIPVRRFGPFDGLIMPPLASRVAVSVMHDDPKALSGELIYKTISNKNLFDDPFDPDYGVRVNPYPKVEFDSLIFSKEWKEQRLTPQAVQLQFRWAREGLVTEFHHPEAFVPHFHMHLYAPETVPVMKFADTFEPLYRSGGVEAGNLGYPVPHIALRSGDEEALKKAAMLFADHLEEEKIWFTQSVFPDPDTHEIVVMFVLLSKEPQRIGFSPVGFMKTIDARADEGLLRDFERRFLDQGTRALIQARVWARWQAMAGDSAMAGQKGGIDLNSGNMDLQIQHNGGRIEFHAGPGVLRQMENASGFMPVIIRIQLMSDLRGFLGVKRQAF